MLHCLMIYISGAQPFSVRGQKIDFLNLSGAKQVGPYDEPVFN